MSDRTIQGPPERRNSRNPRGQVLERRSSPSVSGTFVRSLAVAATIALLLVGVVVIPTLLYPSLDPDASYGLGAAERIQLENERFQLQNDTRSILLAAVAGILVVLGATIAFRQLQLSRELNHEQLRLNRQALIADRYTRAIEQLGHDVLDVRLGGLYGLERVARDSLDDRSTVVEVLTAYVREHAPWPPRLQELESFGELPSLRVRQADVQIAVIVLGRIAVMGDAGDVELGPVDLRKADLRDTYFAGATFTGAQLDGVNLIYANLRQALLRGASLSQANLYGAVLIYADLTGADLQYCALRNAELSAANLQDARLVEADLQNARLDGARLLRADLTRANLRGASLRGAGLQGAILAGADLSEADLTDADLSHSKADVSTRWPLMFDPHRADVVIVPEPTPLA